MTDLLITCISGTAHLTGRSRDLKPVALDDVLGATLARKAWLKANETGAAAQAALTDARNAWYREHKETDYAERASWVHACERFVADLDAAVSASERKAKAALVAYDAAQTAGMASAGSSFASAWLDADAAAIAALAALEEALDTRLGLDRYVVQPEHSAAPGRGSFVFSSALGADRRSFTAQPQRADIALVVTIAPRDLVRASVAK